MANNLITRLDQVAQANLTQVAYDELGTTHIYQDLLTYTNAFAAGWINSQRLLRAARFSTTGITNLKWPPVLSGR